MSAKLRRRRITEFIAAGIDKPDRRITRGF
jgi:hypothetical protein